MAGSFAIPDQAVAPPRYYLLIGKDKDIRALTFEMESEYPFERKYATDIPKISSFPPRKTDEKEYPPSSIQDGVLTQLDGILKRQRMTPDIRPTMVRGSCCTDLLWLSGGYQVSDMISSKSPNNGDLRHFHILSQYQGAMWSKAFYPEEDKDKEVSPTDNGDTIRRNSWEEGVSMPGDKD